MAMSRLDRFLLFDRWITTWGVTSQWELKREVSDHCQLVLKMGNREWGPRPFRFNNCWLAQPGFDKVVVDCWSEVRFTG